MLNYFFQPCVDIQPINSNTANAMLSAAVSIFKAQWPQGYMYCRLGEHTARHSISAGAAVREMCSEFQLESLL